jgi:hypothetical protein
VTLAKAIAWIGVVAGVFGLLSALIEDQPPAAFVIIGAVAALAVLITWVTAWVHAILTSRYRWALGAFFIWPVAFVYVLTQPMAGSTSA